MAIYFFNSVSFVSFFLRGSGEFRGLNCKPICYRNKYEKAAANGNIGQKLKGTRTSRGESLFCLGRLRG